MKEDHLLQGWPKDRVGEMRNALDQLRRDRIVRILNHTHGRIVFIRPDIRFEVYQRIVEHDDYAWLR